MLTKHLNLLVCISSKLIEGNDNCLTETLQVSDMLIKIPITILHTSDIWFLDIFQSHSTMHLQRLKSNNQHSQVWLQSSFTAFDIIELLCTQISTESSLSNSIVAVFKSSGCSHYRITSVGNIGKRTTVYESRRSLSSLYEIWLQRIQQQCHDTTTYSHIFHCERLVILCNTKQDIVDAAAEIIDTCGKTHDGHNLRSRSNIKACFCLNAILIAKTGDDAAQTTIIYIHHAAPENLLELESFSLVLITVVVEKGSNHIVGFSNSMEIACKMEIDFIHRKHLSIATASSSTLHTKTRTQRRFSESHHSILANLLHTKCQTHAHRSLTIACLGWTDSSNKNKMMTGKLLFVNSPGSHLSNISTIIFDLVLMKTQFSCHVVDRAQLY